MTCIGALGHLCDTNDLALDQISFIYGSESPWLDKLVRELAMKKDAALFYTLCYPLVEGALSCQIVYVLLFEYILCVRLL